MKRTVSGIILLLMLISTYTLAFNSQPAKAELGTWAVDDNGPVGNYPLMNSFGAISGNLQILEPINGSVIVGLVNITFTIENTGSDIEFLNGDPSNRIDLEIEYSSSGGEIEGWGIMLWSTSYNGLVLHSGEEFTQTVLYDPSEYEGATPPDFVGDAPYGEATIRLVHWKQMVEGFVYGEFGITETKVTLMWSPPVITATIDIHPRVLNLRSRGKWITGCIGLSESYDVADINVSTILLNDTIPVEMHPIRIADKDGDGIPDLMVKFDRAEVISYILANVNMRELIKRRFMTVTLTVTGYLDDGTPFEGSDTIGIILPMPSYKSLRLLEKLEMLSM